jgi:tRNA-splicing ligase RtcB (3'-phosphate/5'-hydroxy nucleic acid ligase)
MYATLLPAGTATGTFMDALQASTRFGPGGRPSEGWVKDAITDEIEDTKNPYLAQLAHRAKAQLADQGDGNHFAFVGSLAVTPALSAQLRAKGQAALADALTGRDIVDVLVTHHGSRDLGAQVYKRGIATAVAQTKRMSPDTPPHQAWIDPATDDGVSYWEALQYVARWTKRNHQSTRARWCGSASRRSPHSATSTTSSGSGATCIFTARARHRLGQMTQATRCLA